jgi:hypothetical protein
MNDRKRVLLFALVGIAAFYVGYFAFRDGQALSWFRYAGYWTIGLTFALFLYLTHRGYRGCAASILAYGKSRAGRIGLLVAVLGSVFLFRAETLGFKTIMDDHILAGTAMGMHEEREVYTATRIVSINGAPARMRGFVDKRPIFQPFLVSTVHDLTGFRPLNGVYFNAALTPFILLLLYVLAERVGGVGVGVGATALFCSVPLLSYICAGGGMEPLNLFFILLTCLLGGYYLKAPDPWRLGALVFSGILLAQCRYESVLFIVPVGMVIIWSWIRERTLLVPWSLILCPLFLIPALWQHRIFRMAKHMWQMDEGMEPFGLGYIYDNFGRAVAHFFDFSVATSNSWLPAVVGVVALLLLGVAGLRRVRSFRELPGMTQSAVIFLTGFIMLFILLLGYGWEFDSPVITRLSLPLYIPLSLAGAYLVFGYISSRCVHRVAAAAIVIYFLAYAYPATSRHVYADTYVAGHEFDLAEKFLQEHAGERMMVVADDAVFFSLYGVNILSTDLANQRKAAFKFYLEQPNTPPVYYFHRQVYNPLTKTFETASKGKLDGDFVRETAWEVPYTEMRKVAFERIVDVKNVEVEEPEYKNDMDYLKFWGRNLP